MKPNILLIVADQQRYDCIGYSKQYPVQTPNIDRLAEEGVWFTNAYTPIPICAPARQALLNGRRPETFGALWNYGISLDVPALSPDEYTWVRDMGESGYRSTFIGKWSGHPEHGPCRYGFNNYVSLQDYSHFRKEKYPDAEYKKSWMGEVDPVPYQDNVSHWLAEEAVKQLKQYSTEEEPWHIRLDFPGPHLPCRPSAEFASMYQGKDIPPWPSFKETFHNKPYIQMQQLYSWDIEDYTWDDWQETVALYYATISEIDHAIGSVLKALEETGQAENTIVIYTTDHGDMCGSHRMIDKHYIMYDDVVRVPLVIRWPGVIPPSQVRHEFVCHFLDLPPTLLDMLGKKVPEFFSGRSLLPLLRGGQAEDWRTEAVSTYNGQQFGLYTQRMIRNNDWKYIWNTTDIDELYDLRKDPHELYNVIDREENQAVVAELRGRLYETLLREGDGLVKSPWMKNQLLNNRKINYRA
ncbi:MAG TPA: sulfatase-like hydrolase/transferase [Clostridiales bacterium]|jgi:arylsulfatase A-like enzyme|nr:sulfatase-like hydrolase/transferase [Clostridiales bacterium]